MLPIPVLENRAHNETKNQDDRPMRQHHLHVRKFRDGDELAIVQLFNSTYHEYGGFVPRTVEYLRWCCLERPDVEREGVFLAFDGERLCGYLVAGSSGNIWELCVEDDDREVARILIDEAVSHLEKMGVSSVSVNIPRNSRIIEEVHEASFNEVPAPRMFFTTLSPAALVRALAIPRKEVLAERLEDNFSIHLRDVPYGTDEKFSVEIHNSCVEVIEGFPAKPSVTVELKFKDFLLILSGGPSSVRMLLNGKMKIHPFWKSRAVVILLSAMRLKNPWFFPLSDSI